MKYFDFLNIVQAFSMHWNCYRVICYKVIIFLVSIINVKRSEFCFPKKQELAVEMSSYMAMTWVSLQKVSSLEENIIKQISHTWQTKTFAECFEWCGNISTFVLQLTGKTWFKVLEMRLFINICLLVPVLTFVW
jgi:hypothetical protein